MSLSQAANLVEKIAGHGSNAETAQDITNPAIDRSKYGHPTETMKALVWQGKNSVAIQEVPKPVVVEDRDVILKVTGSTLCGSDLHLLHGAIVQLQNGDILGHEFCGVVESMGKDVTGLKEGDRVVASFQIACGNCQFCDRKLSSQCEKTNSNTTEHGMYGGNTAGMFGYSHFTGGFAGGQAEYVRVPFGDVNLLKLPDDVPDEKGLYLSDVISTSWNCVVDTGVKDGDVVAVWGAGPIGQMVVDFCFFNGAKRVILIDSVQWRLDLVKQKEPRVELLNFSQLPRGKYVPAALKELEPSGIDVALECVAGEYAKGWAHYFEMQLGLETDTSEIVNEMIESVKSYGRCGITGVYVGYTNHFNIGSLMERGIRLIGNGQAPVHYYWEDLLKKIQSGEIDPMRMLSHRIKLDDLAKVYYKFENREDGLQKIYVETKFSAPAAAGSPALTTY
uniref:Alcohol dehydrogenase-like N-terminal domain-containing protein n=1 Tax=Araucaria cunninghamii TaxID=56994 RepID=A0A0D6R0T0_ARACU